MAAVTIHTPDHAMARAPIPTRGLERLRLLKPAPVGATSVDRARHALEAAGFFVHVASTSPLRIVGGTARSEGPPPVVYADGFCMVAEDGRYAVASTSRKGRALDGTSYESLSAAVDALVKGYGEVPGSRDDQAP